SASHRRSRDRGAGSGRTRRGRLSRRLLLIETLSRKLCHRASTDGTAFLLTPENKQRKYGKKRNDQRSQAQKCSGAGNKTKRQEGGHQICRYLRHLAAL